MFNLSLSISSYVVLSFLSSSACRDLSSRLCVEYAALWISGCTRKQRMYHPRPSDLWTITSVWILKSWQEWWENERDLQMTEWKCGGRWSGPQRSESMWLFCHNQSNLNLIDFSFFNHNVSVTNFNSGLWRTGLGKSRWSYWCKMCFLLSHLWSLSLIHLLNH